MDADIYRDQALMKARTLSHNALHILNYLAKNSAGTIERIHKELRLPKSTVSYHIYRLEKEDLLTPEEVFGDKRAKPRKLTLFGTDVLKVYGEAYGIPAPNIGAPENDQYDISLEDIRALKGVWHKRVDKSFSEMEKHLDAFNEIYHALNSAKVIILNAEGNSMLASLLELNRFPQKKPCAVYPIKEIPAIDDWIDKETVILTVSATGKKKMADEIEGLYEKIRSYPDIEERINEITSIGITTAPDSPLRDICAPFLVLSGNNKDSGSSAQYPSDYLGETFEKTILMDLNALWIINAYKNKISESVFSRRHKPRS